MEQVEEICDHIVLVNKGGKILDGTVSGVKQQFKENLFEISFADAQPVSSSPVFDVVGQKQHALVVRINEGYSSNDLLSHFLNDGHAITSFNEILPSLNDIFIRLVEGTPTARQFQTVTA
ncbi:MAG: transporter ATP-binding protein, partial [Flaviaesturariibacter sp.]|nr:transporter ATP-binding protein [Flaviaesturariibacter sp.]